MSLTANLSDLAVAVPKIEARRSRDNQYPPVNSGPHRVRRGAQGILDEEVGFLD
jgi:hypothetical protein